MAARYAHTKQFKRHNRELNSLRTRLGRLIRDIRRKIDGDEQLRETIAILLLHADQVRRVPVELSPPLRYITPQVVAIPGDRLNGLQCRGRVTRPARGTLKLLRNGEVLWRHEVSLWPEQRIRLPGRRISLDALEALEVRLDEQPA